MVQTVLRSSPQAASVLLARDDLPATATAGMLAWAIRECTRLPASHTLREVFFAVAIIERHCAAGEKLSERDVGRLCRVVERMPETPRPRDRRCARRINRGTASLLALLYAGEAPADLVIRHYPGLRR